MREGILYIHSKQVENLENPTAQHLTCYRFNFYIITEVA